MNLVYGVMANGIFLSSRMERKIRRNPPPDGVYCMDMESEDFIATLQPADLHEAAKAFRKASKILVVRGISFKDSMVPHDPVKYDTIPFRVNGATYGDFEEIEAVSVRNGPFWFLQTVDTQNAYPLMDLSEKFDSDDRQDFRDIKGLTPSMRIMYVFMLVEKQREAEEARRVEEELRLADEAERHRKEMEEPTNFIRHVMGGAGAEVQSVTKNNNGWEVVWTSDGYTMGTLLDLNMRVVDGGFCMSDYDAMHSARSVVKIFKQYIHDGDSIHITRTPRTR